MSKKRQIAIALSSTSLLSALIVGCGEEKSTQNQDSRVNIVGGKAVGADVSDARRLSTVALTTDFTSVVRPGVNPLFELGRSFCTATVISNKALMTAAHCIQDFDMRSKRKSNSWILPAASHFIASFEIKVGKQGRWMRADKVIPHPEWDPVQTLSGDPTHAPHDIGIIILENKIPDEYAPVEIASEDFALSEKQPVTLVGFGVTLSRRNNNTGVLREVQLPLQKVDKKSQILSVGSWMKGACAGDSGGPMYAKRPDGSWVVVGVTSAGIEILQTCIGLENSYTDARTHKNWIRTVLKENGEELL